MLDLESDTQHAEPIALDERKKGKKSKRAKVGKKSHSAREHEPDAEAPHPEASSSGSPPEVQWNCYRSPSVRERPGNAKESRN